MNNSKKYTILVVDDDPDLRDLIVEVLEGAGYSTVEAENGEIAFALINKHKFDLVITDMIMPGGSGLELLDKIQARKVENLKVVIITGFADLTPQKALEKGVTALLPKPFFNGQLIETVRRVLN